MKRLVGVQFKSASKMYLFECEEIGELKNGDGVIVETEFGLGLAKVVCEPCDYEEDRVPPDLKKVIRMAVESDYQRQAKNTDRERNAFELCEKLINEKKLDMKLIRVEYFFDASKAIFYFSAEHRVDFRELVRDLARSLHTRIEMKQIGVRDETKMTGGLGCCGREICCSTFLREFSPVSVKMAKEQNLAMNPNKISGLCGRLMCCLAYEHETYEEMGRDLPKKGKSLDTRDGPMKVIDVNILAQTVTLLGEDGVTVTVPLDKIDRPRSSPPVHPPRAPSEPEARPEPRSSPQRSGKPNRREKQDGYDRKNRIDHKQESQKKEVTVDLPSLEAKPFNDESKQKTDGKSGGAGKGKRRGRRRRRKPKGSSKGPKK